MRRPGQAYHRAIRYMQSAGIVRVVVELEDTEDHGYTDAHPQTTTVEYADGAIKEHAAQKLAQYVWEAAQDQHGPIINARRIAMRIPGAGVVLIPDQAEAA